MWQKFVLFQDVALIHVPMDTVRIKSIVNVFHVRHIVQVVIHQNARAVFPDGVLTRKRNAYQTLDLVVIVPSFMKQDIASLVTRRARLVSAQRRTTAFPVRILYSFKVDDVSPNVTTVTIPRCNHRDQFALLVFRRVRLAFPKWIVQLVKSPYNYRAVNAVPLVPKGELFKARLHKSPIFPFTLKFWIQCFRGKFLILNWL